MSLLELWSPTKVIALFLCSHLCPFLCATVALMLLFSRFTLQYLLCCNRLCFSFTGSTVLTLATCSGGSFLGRGCFFFSLLLCSASVLACPRCVCAWTQWCSASVHAVSWQLCSPCLHPLRADTAHARPRACGSARCVPASRLGPCAPEDCSLLLCSCRPVPSGRQPRPR